MHWFGCNNKVINESYNHNVNYHDICLSFLFLFVSTYIQSIKYELEYNVLIIYYETSVYILLFTAQELGKIKNYNCN